MKNMTKVISSIVLSSALLAGCQSMPNSNQPQAQTQQLSYELLSNYNWQLIEARDASGQTISELYSQPNNPLTLSFSHTQGRDILSLENTCNVHNADYTVSDGSVNVGNFMTTMMACPTPQANFDRSAANIASGNYKLNQTTNGTPLLTVTKDGTTAHFQAVPKS